VTTSSNSFVSKSRWDSVWLVVAESVLLTQWFGCLSNKFVLNLRTVNIEFAVKLEKSGTGIYKTLL
jgi:hypothetical protein